MLTARSSQLLTSMHRMEPMIHYGVWVVVSSFTVSHTFVTPGAGAERPFFMRTSRHEKCQVPTAKKLEWEHFRQILQGNVLAQD